MKHASLLALSLLATACAPTGDVEAPVSGADAPPSPYAFEVRLTMTPRAAEKLASMNERVIVDAMYFGLAASADAPGVDDHGMEVGLGSDEVEVAPQNAVVTTPGSGFDPTHIASIKGEPEVLVNVYSARKSHADNLLSCGIYQGPVKMAQQKPVEIQCDLIYDENGDPIPADL